MAGDLTDSQMALLCRIGEYEPAQDAEAERRDLQRRIDDAYVEPARGRPSSAYRPTAKGAAYLSKRGAGLNEG